MRRRLPLYMVGPGERVEVVELQGGRGVVGKLHNMGLYPGVKIDVIHNQGVGPIMVSVDGRRIGLGTGMAFKVIVSRVEGSTGETGRKR